MHTCTNAKQAIVLFQMAYHQILSMKVYDYFADISLGSCADSVQSLGFHHATSQICSILNCALFVDGGCWCPFSLI